MTASKPYLMMIRPKSRARDFVRAVGVEATRVLYTPLIRIVFNDTVLPNPRGGVFIFTSATGVLAVARQFSGDGRLAFCVGGMTAEQARLAGFNPVVVAQTAQDLLGQIPIGDYIYVRCAQVAFDLTGGLREKGVGVQDVIAYAQHPRDLTQAEHQSLQNRNLCIPVFSAFGAECLLPVLAGLDPHRLKILAISETVAIRFDKSLIKVETAPEPTRAAMIARLGEIMTQPNL